MSEHFPLMSLSALIPISFWLFAWPIWVRFDIFDIIFGVVLTIAYTAAAIETDLPH